MIAERNKYVSYSKEKNCDGQYKDNNANSVILVDKSYLTQDFKSKSKITDELINTTIKEFQLNTEQERAFRIVTNHAVSPKGEQLKMYMGGMGGTGKTRVIKSLQKFFENRKELHRFIVLGPTGTSAALLAGSTYHSFLGLKINDKAKNENISVAQLKARLEGVDYIFLDEVSMAACHAMYKISAQIAKATDIKDKPFGGISIIFAGDFAQLPPVGGASLYSGGFNPQWNLKINPHYQEAAIGKAIWHQVTTVVILRENMRQKVKQRKMQGCELLLCICAMELANLKIYNFCVQG